MDGHLESNSAEPELRVLLEEIDREYLTPRDSNVRAALRRAKQIIDEIHSGRDPIFSVHDIVHHGSLSRGTGLQNFKDLDQVVILDESALRTTRGQRRNPSDAIARLAASISQRRAGLVSMGSIDVRRQDHSVGIVYPQTNFRIDLVPGLREDGRLLIPERGTGEWIVSSPKDVADRLRRASAITPTTVPAIRLLKGWARARGRFAPIPSFAIETLVVDWMLREPQPLEYVVDTFFTLIAERDARRSLVLGRQVRAEAPLTVIDPVSGRNLTPEVTRKQLSTLISTARDACMKMREIRGLIARGSSRRAQTLARDFFVGSAWL